MLVALLVDALIMRLAGTDPWLALQALFQGSFGDLNGIGVTAIRTTPLLITGLAVAIGIRCGLWNLGGDGQIYIGALVATLFALHLGQHWPRLFAVIGACLAGFVGGTAWALIPAVLRAYRGVSEVITTLLLNFVAINVVRLMVEGPMGQPGTSFPASPILPTNVTLPIVLPNTEFHAGLYIGLGLALATMLLWRTTNFGYELTVVGNNPEAAQFAGIPVRRRLLEGLLLSGGIAGVAGSIEIIGLHHRLIADFSPGYGFDAVVVALLAAARPLYILVAAVFIGALRAGAPALELLLGLPSALVFLTEGLCVLFVVAGYGAQRRLNGLPALARPEADEQGR